MSENDIEKACKLEFKRVVYHDPVISAKLTRWALKLFYTQHSFRFHVDVATLEDDFVTNWLEAHPADLTRKRSTLL